MKLSQLITLTVLAVSAALSGCTPHPLFPPKVMENVSPTFHFEAWRDASPTNPAGKTDAGHKVELGGRIYGPTEDVKRRGDYEFAFLYPGEIDSQDLRAGNRFIIVGTTTSRRPVMVNGVPKTEPFLVADCIHVWRTGRTEIAEFKEDVGGGYSTLPEKTYCVNNGK